MKKNSGRLVLLVMLVCGGFSTVLVGQAGAEEPYVQFLNSLRENRYFDMAEEYLSRLAEDPQISADFKQRLPYERAVTLIQGSTTIANHEARGKQLDRAEAFIKEFVAENAQHPLKIKANSQLGNLLQLRASSNVTRANTPSQRSRKAELLAAGRKHYLESHKVFMISKEAIKKQLEGMKGALDPKTQQKEIAVRNEFRKDYLQLQLLGALILEETADTVEPGTEEYKKYLNDAAKQFDEIYTKYRSLNAGVYSRVYQGRCYKKLGQLKEALGYLNEILQQPDNPAFREVKTTALVLAMECWLHESQKKYAQAVAQGDEWVGDMRPNETNHPDWLQLRLLLAEGHLFYAAKLKGENPRDKQVRRSEIQARKLARDVARFSGDYKEQAQALLAKMPGGDNTAETPEDDPETFAEAKDAAKEAIDGWSTAKLVLQVVPGRLQEETNVEVKQELQKQLAKAETKVASSLPRAVELYRLALGFVDDETPVGDIQTVYYYMAFCNYQMKEFYDAAMLGEFLARRYPESTGAKSGAKIALSAYHNLLLLKAPADRDFENSRLASVAQYMVDSWPESPETIDARVKLIPELLKAGNVQLAITYIKALPEKHQSRADMELRVGREIWRQYRVQAKRFRTLQEESPGVDELNTMKQQMTDTRELAAEYLQQGLSRVGKSTKPSAALALSVLALSQYHVEVNEPEKAVSQMEAPGMGVLAIAQDPKGKDLFGNNEAMFSRFSQDSHMLGLRAYIGVLPDSKNPEQTIEKAKKVMKSLEQRVSKETLVSIYYSLARNLESQLALSETDAEKKTLAQGFETFLDEVGNASNEFNVKNWVAETLYGLGKGFDTDSKKLTAEAKQYYDKSIKSYEAIVSRGKADPKFLNPDPAQSQRIALSLQLRLAKAKRQLRDYQGALDLLHEILVSKSTMLDVQIEAARTYQLWGDDTQLASSKREQQYLNAIAGGFPNTKTKRNTVWGWSQLGKVTGRYLPKFQSQFHEARYNMAVCRYKYALRKKAKSADRKKYMGYAKAELMNTYKLYPKMGGKLWQPRYNSLLMRIQKELGEKATGLPKAAT